VSELSWRGSYGCALAPACRRGPRRSSSYEPQWRGQRPRISGAALRRRSAMSWRSSCDISSRCAMFRHCSRRRLAAFGARWYCTVTCVVLRVFAGRKSELLPCGGLKQWQALRRERAACAARWRQRQLKWLRKALKLTEFFSRPSVAASVHRARRTAAKAASSLTQRQPHAAHLHQAPVPAREGVERAGVAIAHHHAHGPARAPVAPAGALQHRPAQ
jgi:hypothetical protein